MDDDILKGLADNPMLFDAVKKVLKSHFEFEVGNMPVCSVDELGKIVLARMEGLALLDKGFAEIARLRTVKDKPDTRMPAR